MAELFPPSWLHPRMLKLVMDFIRHQTISAKQKKYMLYEWCRVVGVEMTAFMVEYVTGYSAGKI